MRIHISQPCKELLPQQYKTEERTGEPDLTEKVRNIEEGTSFSEKKKFKLLN